MSKIHDVIYPAIFTQEEDGVWSVEFPDIKNAVTQGDSVEDAYRMAVELLSAMVYDDITGGRELPKPSQVNEIPHDPDAEFVTLVSSRIASVSASESYVRVNCTLPEWMKTEAAAANIDFSKTLQEGLREKLGIDR
ncbi:type II toxin-antitoxin system HicB family antitoxin [Paenibacillus larvae]|uniref:type II toxin-antitoxin system HicB family antitoxin n=1 Tax=Paenibacillus larvae TaxID=1464 RepID=UPI002282A82A|nr:type II toxin-antitoxin system HicB family antitoxin [Paenibacillus larvae]MCY9512013.1 type II toxin-antitoxin system HicB family antitoxin [Paenibacillus larvae]MCY9526622.1 type II toxin-antitoxin system HicB family antitoxin [Paenibacillus larvae]